jgi:hypothetical protein
MAVILPRRSLRASGTRVNFRFILNNISQNLALINKSRQVGILFKHPFLKARNTLI